MANALFNKGREGILDGTIDIPGGDIRVMLVLSTYNFDATDKFISELGAVDNGRSAAGLQNKTEVDGVFDSDDIAIVATAAAASKAFIYFVHTGNDATARLIYYMDTPASGLPFTPAAGQTVNCVHDNGANKIFKI